MKAGVAEVDVTPPVGCWIVGPVAKSTGMHDPLFGRALVLDDGTRKIAILSIDLIGVGWELADELRSLIRERAGVDFVLMQFSHTHNAPFPPTWMVSVHEQDRELLAGWRDHLREALPRIVKEAAEKLAPAELRVGRASVQIGFHRRVVGENGVVHMDVNKDGPVVPWVDVLAVYGEDGRPLAVVFEHAAHPVIVHAASTLFSADYPGFASRRLREKLGADAMPMFVQGCGANINGYPVGSGFENAEKAGHTLADAVLAALKKAKPLTAETLKVASRRVDLPCTDLPPAEEVEQKLAKIKAEIAEREAEGKAYIGLYDQVEALQDLLRMIRTGERPTMRLEMAMVSAGQQWALVSLSGEMFCEYQLWIDEHAPFEQTMVAAYADNFGGYIATDAELALGEKGGYEAGCWPAFTCALIVPTRVALQVGVEKRIHRAVEGMWAE